MIPAVVTAAVEEEEMAAVEPGQINRKNAGCQKTGIFHVIVFPSVNHGFPSIIPLLRQAQVFLPLQAPLSV